jgi:hypothetical protein
MRELFNQEESSIGAPDTLDEHQNTAEPAPLPPALSPEVMEELTQENRARHDWVAEEGQPPRAPQRHAYRTDRGVCAACSLKPQCTSSAGRRIHRRIDEDYLDRVRASHQTEPYQKAMRKRKVWVEPIFAEAKLRHGM